VCHDEVRIRRCLRKGRGIGRIGVSRADRVHPDIRPERHGKRARQLRDSGFRRSIRDELSESSDPNDGTDVYHRCFSPQVRGERLHHEEHALEVHVEDGVPFILRGVLKALRKDDPALL
jgi:hypothetical protein